MRSVDDPAISTPDQRLHDVANIMAAGLLRLHTRAALSGTDSGQKNLPDSGKPGLDVSQKTVLSVHCG
jgi:hypothetical protein